MDIMKKNNDRITKIRNDRINLLQMVNESIKNNNTNLSESIDTIKAVLAYDEHNTKKYEALIKSQDLITNLTIEISKCNKEEEIIKLRNKLNYYINKIKKEIKNRNIDPNYMLIYQDKITYLRKDIAKYIRFIKRNNKLDEIQTLNEDYQILSDEDKEKLKKMLKIESRYNYRNSINNKTDNKQRLNKSSNNKETKKTIANNLEEIDGILKEVNSNREEIDDILNEVNSILDESNRKTELNSDIEYLNERIKIYNSRYNISKINEYNHSFIKNFINLIKNIPGYTKNKKVINNMKHDSETFYNGADLTGYIAYLKKKNSIKEGLRSIFSRTYLYSQEGKLLNKHEECAKWIIDFCNKQSLNIEYLRKVKRFS